jgi:excisionase family DNA binding protein
MTDTTMLTVAEAASLLRVAPKTIKNWARVGKIASVRLPSGHIRIPADAVKRIVSPNTEAAS